MNYRGQFSDFFGEDMLPALRAASMGAFKAKKPVFKQVMRAETTNRSIEQFSGVVGVGLPTFIEEGGEISVDSMAQGFDKTLRPLKYGLGIAVSRELVDDDRMGVIKPRPKWLGESIAQAREIQAATVYNNAFATAGSDGVALCSASHPLIKAGGVESNLLTAAADLDVTSLELALTQWSLIKDHRGFYQNNGTPNLLVAEQNRWNAYTLVRAGQKSETANNTVNAFENGENGQAVRGPICWAYLTDPDAWFLVAEPDQTGVVWLDRLAPYNDDYFDKKTETGYLYMRYRSVVGFHDWKGVLGTAGA
jgi:hypothetical protein